MALFTREEALEYHRSPRHGKTEVVLTKRCESQKDLSLAYSPGVAEACKAIAEDRALVSEYTGRANLRRHGRPWARQHRALRRQAGHGR